jgi:Uma2 family endonuclease
MVTTVAEFVTKPIRVEPEKSLVRRFSLAEFETIAEDLPDDRLELINGEIIFMPPPTEAHMDLADHIQELFSLHLARIIARGGQISESRYYALPVELKSKWVEEGEKGPFHVCPDVSIRIRNARQGDRPPALLVVEVLSISKREHIEPDLITKPEVYATLEIPVYWVVDRRDHSVLVYRQPKDGAYEVCQSYTGDSQLPAPGLEFLQITPAQIFEVSDHAL